jgi:hypothetical protein
VFTDAGRAAVGHQSARDHLCGTCSLSVYERCKRPAPLIEQRRSSSPIGSNQGGSTAHGKKRDVGHEQPQRVTRTIGITAAIAAQVEHDPQKRSFATRFQ